MEKGHIKHACLSKRQSKKKKKVHLVDRSKGDNEDDLFIYKLSAECNNVTNRKPAADILWNTPPVNEKNLQTELDTGRAVSANFQSNNYAHFR